MKTGWPQRQPQNSSNNAEHEKHAYKGVFCMFIISPTPSHLPNTPNTSMRACSECLALLCYHYSPRTWETCPCGCVFCIHSEAITTPHIEHKKHTLKGVFFVPGAFLTPFLMLSKRNAPFWACFSYSAPLTSSTNVPKRAHFLRSHPPHVTISALLSLILFC